MKAFEVTYELLEPVLVTKPGGDPNTDSSQDYLPGSVVRGALVARYLAGSPPGEEFTRLFLDGRTRFLNAYPLDGARRAGPIPASWRRKKDDQDVSIYDFRHQSDRQAVKLDQKIRELFFRLGEPRDGRTPVLMPSVRYTETLHTTRDRKAGRALREAGNVYRYRALASGQRFAGLILTQTIADATKLKALLVSGDLLLGGAQTAGYGRVHVFLPDSAVHEDQATNWNGYAGSDIPAGRQFTLYFAADAVLRHPATGHTGPYVAETLGRLWPNAGVRYAGPQFGRVRWVGGFNRTWGLPLPQAWAVAAGSVYTLVADELISSADLTAVVERGLGERAAEGFGEVAFNPDWAAQSALAVVKDEMAISEPASPFPTLSANERELIARMNRRLAEAQLDRLVLARAQEIASLHRGRLLSKSQYGRLQLRLRREMGNESGGFADLRAYLRDVAARKSVRDQFRKSRIDGRPLLDWLASFVDKQGMKENPASDAGENERERWSPDAVWRELNMPANGWTLVDHRWQRPFLGEVPYQLDNATAHRLTVRLLIAVFELLAKQARR